MEITAVFTGTNSLGYEKGKEYKLKISESQGVSVQRLDGTGKCPYQSLSSFLKNWDYIRRSQLTDNGIGIGAERIINLKTKQNDSKRKSKQNRKRNGNKKCV